MSQRQVGSDEVERRLREAMSLHQSGDLDAADVGYRRVLEIAPQEADALHLLGITLAQRRRFEEAEQNVRRAIALCPGAAGYYDSLATLLREEERLDESVQACREALRLKPQWGDAHVTLSHALRQLNRLEEAERAAREALRLRPGWSLAELALGAALLESRRSAQAIVHLKAAAAGGEADAHNWLGEAYGALGRLQEAEAAFREGLRIKPGDPQLLNNLATALKDECRIGESIEALRSSLMARADADVYSNLLLTLHYDGGLGPKELWAEHKRWAARHAAPLYPAARANMRERPVGGRRLRVGYVSSDFRAHPVASFIAPILARHDRDQFEVYCYSDVASADATTIGLRGLVERWRDIAGLKDRAVEEMVRADEIDILIDLNGHAGKNRLLVFARRAAAVQVTYLGYPNTTGLATMDYRLTDAAADPPGETDSLHSERLARLAPCAWCYDPAANAPDPASANGRPITFGSFNNYAKLSDRAVALWAEVLRATPGSRLVLKSARLRDPSLMRWAAERFARRGIVADRVVILAPTESHSQHLRAYNQIDVALDTFPYNGTTTTCEALWMGVPVVSLRGETHVSRVGASLLNAAGFGQWIAGSEGEFVEAAVRLVDPAQRSDRGELRRSIQASALCDSKRLTVELERAYKAMAAQKYSSDE